MNSRLNHIQNWPEQAQQANWCATTLAKNCGVSLRTLERFCLKTMGKSPKAWLLEQRQQRAAKLLQDGCSVKETAANLGYKHQNHLSNEFQKRWGCCPSDKSVANRLQSS